MGGVFQQDQVRPRHRCVHVHRLFGEIAHILGAGQKQCWALDIAEPGFVIDPDDGGNAASETVQGYRPDYGGDICHGAGFAAGVNQPKVNSSTTASMPPASTASRRLCQPSRCSAAERQRASQMAVLST